MSLDHLRSRVGLEELEPRLLLSYTISTLHNFDALIAPDGGNPASGVIRDSQGDLFGTTSCGGTNDYGAVYEISAGGTYSTLHSFNNVAGPDGYQPEADLVLDSQGFLYGTTEYGGSGSNGTVFKISTTGGSFATLYSFASDGSEGKHPLAGLVMDGQGDLYGTTSTGGSGGKGTVFKLTSGSLTTLHFFTGTSPDGATPQADLLLDGQGNLYGTTAGGGAQGAGTIFEISTTGSGYQTVHSFTGTGGEGSDPVAGLVLDGQGDLYGTTEWGGQGGNGTVFKFSAGTLTTLYYFNQNGTGGDGEQPLGGVLLDGQGNLFGTTSVAGGANHFGTAFEIASGGSFSTLHAFTGTGTDGSGPSAGLLLDSQGNLFGTTYWGGTSSWGTVFELAVQGADTTPPSPNPETWATPPYAASATSIGMTATTASDPSGVQYEFNNTTIAGHDSGWIVSASWTDTGLSPNTTYTYEVRTRDQSAGQNTGTWSATQSAKTLAAVAPDAFEPNDQSWAAHSVTLDVNGQISASGLTIDKTTDVDWVSFMAPYGCTGAVQVTVSNVSGGLVGRAGVYDTPLGTLAELVPSLATLYGPEATADAGGANQAVTLNWTGLHAGSFYYVKVSGLTSTTGHYDLGISAAMMAPDALEANNTSGTATNATTTLVSGNGACCYTSLSIHRSTDEDWFRIDTPANTDGNLVATISHLTGGLQGLVWVYQHYTWGDVPMGLGVYASWMPGGAGTATIYNAQPNTTYYIRVDNFWAETGGYQLDVTLPLDQQAKDAYESGAGNNVSWLAHPLTLTGNAATVNNLSIHNTADQDWFSFMPTSNGNVTITVSGVSGGLVTHVGLYDSAVGTLADQYGGIFTTLFGPKATQDALSANQTVTLTYSGLHAYTTYYVKVSGDSNTTGLYTLDLLLS